MEIQSLKIGEDAYPRWLREIFDAPKRLYYAGDLAVLERPMVAIVGTRRMTSYGEAQAFQIARELSRRGICIVSGLAYGVDAAAHKGALEGHGGTIAVLAQGLPEIRPARNKGLAERILGSGGLLLSENEAGKEIFKQEYLRRNRIISGLARGVLVVEAGYRSGAVNTACHALEQNREVMALPGRLIDEQSAGALRLLKDGAALVRNAEEVAECLGLPWEKVFDVSLKGVELVVFEILKKQPMTAAELGECFEGRLKELYGVLGGLEMRGLVRRGVDLKYGVVA
jgi:DNA processing protein